jgi:hypothetical protein
MDSGDAERRTSPEKLDDTWQKQPGGTTWGRLQARGVLACGIIYLMHGKVPVYSTYEASFSHIYRVSGHYGQLASLRLGLL